MIKVSVLFPVYNTKEEYLRAAIESILNQTFKDFEFLIINDASSDENVEKVVKSYNDERINYIVNERNLGISKTRNKLMQLAKGEYLAVMDHDDISMPDRFEKQAAFLDENHDIGVLSGQYKEIPQGNVSSHFIYDKEIKLALLYSCIIVHSATMFRKSVLVENNIWYEEDFSPAEDYALFCRLIRYTKFHNLPDVLLYYRRHDQNTSKIQSKKMYNSTLAVRAFVKADNPALYNLLLLNATHTTRYKLFGFFSFFKVLKKGDITKVMIFGNVPILTLKQKIKLEVE